MFHLMKFSDTPNWGARNTKKVGRTSCWVLWECGWARGFHMDASQAPTALLTPKNNRRRWAFESGHWALTPSAMVGPKKRESGEDQKGRGNRLVKVWLTRQQATANYGAGQRANVPVRKWKRAIQRSCTASTLGINWTVHNCEVPSYWITTIIIKGHTVFPGHDCVCSETRSKTTCRKLHFGRRSKGQPDTPQLEPTHWNSQPGCSEVEACGNHWA